MMIDILSGMLSGSAYGDKLRSFHELEGPTGVGASFICIDVACFIGAVDFEHAITEYAERIKGLRKQPGFAEILLPGEFETRKELESSASGIEVPDAIVAGIDEISARLGCSSRLGTIGTQGA
jgi:LDH2 family malate/lactate/ureidoglycolate dehydrogenase